MARPQTLNSEDGGCLNLLYHELALEQDSPGEDFPRSRDCT